MPALGLFVVFALFALVVPLLLYGMLDAEDPDPSHATSWDDARSRARNDHSGGRRSQRDAGEDENENEDDSRRDDSSVDGNHWG